MYYLDSL